MRILLKKLQECKSSFIELNKKQYSLQLYSDGRQGNIIRMNSSVLVRFYIEDNKISLSFAKENNPTEFGYRKFHVSLDENLDEVKKIQHQDAEELYEVLKVFVTHC